MIATLTIQNTTTSIYSIETQNQERQVLTSKVHNQLCTVSASLFAILELVNSGGLARAKIVILYSAMQVTLLITLRESVDEPTSVETLRLLLRSHLQSFSFLTVQRILRFGK